MGYYKKKRKRKKKLLQWNEKCFLGQSSNSDRSGRNGFIAAFKSPEVKEVN